MKHKTQWMPTRDIDIYFTGSTLCSSLASEVVSNATALEQQLQELERQADEVESTVSETERLVTASEEALDRVKEIIFGWMPIFIMELKNI